MNKIDENDKEYKIQYEKIINEFNVNLSNAIEHEKNIINETIIRK
jgi:hypothetical protein